MVRSRDCNPGEAKLIDGIGQVINISGGAAM